MSSRKLKISNNQEEVYCCCEYQNLVGERSHILACCCDCEHLDNACDRCLTCRPVPLTMIAQVLEVLVDRCRVPTLFRRSGAVRIPLSLLYIIFSVPISLAIAAVHPVLTFIMIIVTPLSVIFINKMSVRDKKQKRSAFIYYWGLFSSIYIFYFFQFVIISMRKILLVENLTVSTLFALAALAAFRTRKRAKFIPKNLNNPMMKKTPEDVIFQNRSNQTILNNDASSETRHAVDAMQNYFSATLGFNSDTVKAEVTDLSYRISEEEQELARELSGPPESQVSWVDSRPIVNGRLSVWCEQCGGLSRPARSGHCPLCERCVSGRDHHCVWIDACIGADNHRAFLASLFLFVLTAGYGSHLTLTTVCTPALYRGFLVVENCSDVYGDYLIAYSFVAACYMLATALFMLVVFCLQVILISQNLTSQEHHQAVRRRLTVAHFYVRNNVNNRGFLRNWVNFLFNRRSLDYGGVGHI